MQRPSTAHRFGALAGILLIATALTGCDRQKASGSNSGSEPLKPLDILIDWQAEPTYLGVYYAVQKGYLRDAGYDAKVTQSWGANQAVAAIAAGKNIIGTASGGATVLGRNNGADVVSLGVLYPRIPSVVYGLSGSGIRTPADLKGKRIGLYPGSITNNEFDAFLKLNGLKPSDVQTVSLTGADIPLLLAKKVDAVLHYTEMSPVQVETSAEVPGKAGTKTFELKLADYGVGGYGLNIIANRDAFQNDGERMQRASTAIIKGYTTGCANPTDAVAAFVKAFPEKDAAYVRMSWDKVCRLVGAKPGEQSAAGWEQTINLYKSLGLLKVPVRPADIMGAAQ